MNREIENLLDTITTIAEQKDAKITLTNKACEVLIDFIVSIYVESQNNKKCVKYLKFLLECDEVVVNGKKYIKQNGDNIILETIKHTLED